MIEQTERKANIYEMIWRFPDASAYMWTNFESCYRIIQIVSWIDGW